LSCPNVRNTSCLIVDVHMPRMTGIELHRRSVERKLPPRDLRRQMTPFRMIPPVTSEHVNDLIHVGIRGNARLAPANRSA
jgi:hypothetical protein